jgi:hypothetical protein
MFPVTISFNLYLEFILREVNKNIKLNGQCINNIRYIRYTTDDTVVFGNNIESLLKIVKRIVDVSKLWIVS